MRAGQEIADKNITPFLRYLDMRSGEDLHFILPGWSFVEAGRGTSPSAIAKEWMYLDEHFIKACDVISSQTNWQYSGGTDLLLLTTRKLTHDTVKIDFSGAINIALHELKEKKIESPEVLLHRLIMFAKSYKGDYPLISLSIQEARVSFFEAVLNAIVGYLPKEAKERFDYAKQFAVKDVAKKERHKQVMIKIEHGKNISEDTYNDVANRKLTIKSSRGANDIGGSTG